MTAKRKAKFLEAVAEAARAATPKRRQGGPNPGNLTEEGRRKGMDAIRKAPRCRSKRVDGSPCRQPAMRGATRCVKHGGRVEVPAHPHNIRRFLTGEVTRGAVEYGALRSMSNAERTEFLKMLPPNVLQKRRLVTYAARLWIDLRDQGYLGLRRFMDEIARL